MYSQEKDYDVIITWQFIFGFQICLMPRSEYVSVDIKFLVFKRF